MNHPHDPDRTRLDLNPADDPAARAQRPVAQQPYAQQPYAEEARVEQSPVVEQEEVGDPDHRRRRTVGIVCTVINVVCGVFAVVLALHIILVLGSANMANGFAGMIDSWSSAVSLGLRDLFVPSDLKVRTFLNDGLAAIAWIVIAALLTFLVRRFALPSPRRVSHYRRVWR
jgi:hypothetical protein